MDNVALRILDLIEKYHSENACLKLLLKQSGVRGWPAKLQRLMADADIATSLFDEVRRIRVEMLRTKDPHAQLEVLARCVSVPPLKR